MRGDIFMQIAIVEDIENDSRELIKMLKSYFQNKTYLLTGHAIPPVRIFLIPITRDDMTSFSWISIWTV